MSTQADLLAVGHKALREVAGVTLTVTPSGETVSAIPEEAAEYAEIEGMPKKERNEFAFLHVLRGLLSAPRDVTLFTSDDNTYEVLELVDNPNREALRFFCIVRPA